MARRSLALLALTAVLLGFSPTVARAAGPEWDCTPRPLARIPAGTVVGGRTVNGWSDPILFVEGELSHGDLDAVSDTVDYYAKLFNLVMLANVVEDADGFALEKVAIGFSTKIDGRDVVITKDSHKQLGADLSWIGGMVFSGNEDALKDVQQTARYRHGMIVDAPTVMLEGGEHVTRMVRYFIWVSKSTGKVGTLVWAMEKTPQGPYRPLDQPMQLLPRNMHEERAMHVDGDEFTIVGTPSAEAFAVVRIPQGTPVPMTAQLRRVAGIRTFEPKSYVRLLTDVHQGIQSAQAAAANAPRAVDTP